MRGSWIVTALLLAACSHDDGLQTPEVSDGGSGDGGSADIGVPAPAPFIRLVSPPSGPTTGGIPLTILGSGFQSGATVTVGGKTAAQAVRVSESELSALLPAAPGAFGRVDVIATNPDGQRSNAAPFYYGVHFSLEAAGRYVEGALAEGGQLVDFNGDGNLDLVVASAYGGDIGTVEGRGDGSFDFREWLYPVGGAPRDVLAADFDGDGLMDLMAATGPRLVALRRLGKNLQFKEVWSSAASTLAVAVGDLDGDHKPDLVFPSQGSVSVLLGNGDCSFRPVKGDPAYPVPGFVEPAIRDLNGDGKADVVAIVGGQGVVVLMGKGDGTLAAAATVPLANSPRVMAIGDLNGDARADLVVAEDDVSGLNTGFLAILLGNPMGGFDPPTYRLLPTVIGPLEMSMGDWNGDGKLDLAVGSSAIAHRIDILLGRGDGTFEAGDTYTAAGGTYGMASGDLDHDGKTDLVWMSSNGEFGVNVLMGSGDGTFRSMRSYPVGWRPLALAPGDFDGDGRSDLVSVGVGDPAHTGIYVMTSTPTGRFEVGPQGVTGMGPVAVAAADFNGDGHLDAVSANELGNDVSVLLGNGTKTLGGAASFAAGKKPSAIAAVDLDGDHKVDLVVANQDGNDASILLGKGDGTFAPAVSQPVGMRPRALAVGDFNGDGRADFVTANYDGGDLTVLLGSGKGAFLPAVHYAVGPKPVALVALDTNGDGRLDLAVVDDAVAQPYRSTIRLLLGNGDGTFQPATSFTAGDMSATGLAAGDLDGDGAVDLVVATWAGAVVFLGRGNATFQPPATFVGGSGNLSPVVGDWNGDHRPDLAVASWEAIGVFRNDSK